MRAARFSPRVFSGIQPTGIPHLGNYLGAVANWVKLQSAPIDPAHPTLPRARGDAIYCVVDLHAMTMPYRASELTASCRSMAASLVACGIDPSKSILFRQSAVREHAELGWIFSCVTPLGWLKRMTQYKQKASKEKDNACLGLLSYPVLQAADILLYKGTHVPVGEDQNQHLELSRDIAASFNNAFSAGGGDVFPLPATISMEGRATRVMSLRDGTKKMSKSDPDEASRINLTDSPDVIRDKIRRSKTDSTTGFSFDPETRPDKSNLLTIYSAVSGESIESLVGRYASSDALSFKNDLADAIIAFVSPIGAETKRWLDDGDSIDRVLEEGGRQAREIAVTTMEEVRQVTGLHV